MTIEILSLRYKINKPAGTCHCDTYNQLCLERSGVTGKFLAPLKKIDVFFPSTKKETIACEASFVGSGCPQTSCRYHIDNAIDHCV